MRGKRKINKMKYEKQILFLAIVLFFFAVYPLINEYTVGHDAEAHILYTYYDGIMPFVPAFIIPYMSGFVMPMFLYFFIKDKIFFRRAALSYFIMMCIAYATYILYPVTVIIRPESMKSIFAPVFQLFYPFDPPYNAFPSLHVAMPLLAAMIVFHYNKKYWWMLVWAAGIILSTFFVKQHYLADVAAGLILAIGAYMFFVKINVY